VLLAWLVACTGSTVDAPAVDAPSVDAAAEAGAVVVYSGRSESLMEPVFEMIRSELGLELDVQYGDTAQMVTRLATEGAESPADLILAQEVGHLDVLARRDLLATLPDDLLAAVDPRFADPARHWVGTSGRLRVLVIDTEQVPDAERPKTLKELADPKWKGKLGWAPTNGSLQSHLGALCALWGEAETKTWLQGVLANEPNKYPKNSPQVDAADQGDIAIGWVNHYYLHRKDRTRAVNHSLTEAGDAGNLLMLSGGAVRAGAAHPEGADKVLRYLVSEPAQQYFAREVFEYPVRPGVGTHPDVPALDTVGLAEVDPTALTDLGCARRLLDETGQL
jgi:iron(III) transport system substrate-binding protein